MPQPTAYSIIYFDDACRLCNAYVQWLIKRDVQQVFKFVALEQYAGRFPFYMQNNKTANTFVLEQNGKLYTKSAAVIQILKQLNIPYKILGAAIQLIPKNIRERVYNWVAKNRYRWFGKTAAVCNFQLSQSHRFIIP